MRKLLNHLEEVALYIVTLFLLGILVSKMFGHLSVDDTFTQVITVVQIIAAMILCWIAGWKKGHGK